MLSRCDGDINTTLAMTGKVLDTLRYLCTLFMYAWSWAVLVSLADSYQMASLCEVCYHLGDRKKGGRGS